jgi:hypothetical protein
MIEKLNYPIGTEAEWQLKLAIDKINEIIDHMEQGKVSFGNSVIDYGDKPSQEVPEIRAILNRLVRRGMSVSDQKGFKEHIDKDVDLALQQISRLTKPSVSVEDIRQVIVQREYVPDACVDSGQVEWSVGESRKLAQAIHNLINGR